VLDVAPAVAASWRHRYRRLHLHTVKEHSALPGLPFDPEIPRYPARLEVVAYLEAYARAYGITPRFGVEARRVCRGTDGFEVETSDGAIRARAVVMATGLNRRPRAPTYPGQASFRGAVEHSTSYVDAAPYLGRRVLVVGFGNSGAEIALDLAESAVDVTVAVRGPVNVLPRDFLGMPTQLTAIRFGRLPLRVRDRVGRLVARLAFGDLRRYGLTPHPVGPATQIERHGRIPVLDIGALGAIQRGTLRVAPQIAELTPTAVRFVDGREQRCDHVILATGFEPGLDELLAPELVPAGGIPPAVTSRTPGLYFVGFQNVPGGLLREIGREAELVAEALAPATRAGAREPAAEVQPTS
jgi:cation diffusion facilitator CzcD-associated flavoprotein CzcO